MTHSQPHGLPAREETLWQAVKYVARSVRRHKLALFFSMVLSLAAAGGYLTVADPKFTAQALIVVDPTRPVTFMAGQMANGSTADSAAVLSQLEMLRSEKLAAEVVDTGALDGTPEAHLKSWKDMAIDAVRSRIWGKSERVDPARAEMRRRAAMLRLLRDQATIERLGISYLISISYLSRDPEAAARVANTIAAAFLQQQQEAKLTALRETNGWLTDRALELQQAIRDSETALEKFRAANDLYESGGALLSERDLGDLVGRYSAAQARLADAQQKLDIANSALSSYGENASLPETINNTLIQKMRERYAEIAEQISSLEQERGPDHGSVQLLRRELAQVSASIRRELQLIVETTAQDLVSAQSQASFLQTRLAEVKRKLAEQKEKQVELRALDRAATLARSTYDAFLTRAQAVQGEEAIPVGARVVSPASAPVLPSHPRSLVVLAFAFIFGGLVGLALCLLRENRAHEAASLDFEPVGLPVAPAAGMARR